MHTKIEFKSVPPTWITQSLGTIHIDGPRSNSFHCDARLEVAGAIAALLFAVPRIDGPFDAIESLRVCLRQIRPNARHSLPSGMQFERIVATFQPPEATLEVRPSCRGDVCRVSWSCGPTGKDAMQVSAYIKRRNSDTVWDLARKATDALIEMANVADCFRHQLPDGKIPLVALHWK